MNARKITVVDSSLQKRSVIMSEAETLGELKRDLAANGIDYAGKTFMEGLSRSELKEDASLLPHDIQRNGTVTNELVFMLTTPERKIKSGALTRQECYEKVKSLGLSEAVKSRFGKNFTQCSTDDLNTFLAARSGKVAKKETSSLKDSSKKTPSKKEEKGSGDVINNAKAFVAKMLKAGAISAQNAKALNDILSGGKVAEVDSSYTDAEIKSMFSSMVK